MSKTEQDFPWIGSLSICACYYSYFVYLHPLPTIPLLFPRIKIRHFYNFTFCSVANPEEISWFHLNLKEAGVHMLGSHKGSGELWNLPKKPDFPNQHPRWESNVP